MNNIRKVSFFSLCAAVVFALVSVFFFGCSTSDLSEKGETGSIIININDDTFNTKNIEPALDMEIAYYTVYAEGPDTATVPLTRIDKPSSSISINMLDVGTWIFHTNGWNSNDIEVGYVEVTGIEINSGQVTNIDMIIIPVIGVGTLSIDVGWTPFDLLASPSVISEIASVNDLLTKTDLSSLYSINSINVDYSGVYDNGWYLLTFILNDNVGSPTPIETPIFGFAEAVRIIRSEISQYTTILTVDDINSVVGTALVNLTEQMDNPIPITFNGVEIFLLEGNDMTVQAQTPIDPDLDSHMWFLNGVLLPAEVTDTIIIGSALQISTNTLSLVVKKNGILSSKSIVFNVVDEFPPITGNYVDGINNLTLNADMTFELTWSIGVHSMRGTYIDDGSSLTFNVETLMNSLMYDFTYWPLASTEGQAIWYYVENSRADTQNDIVSYVYNGVNLIFTWSTFSYDFVKE